MNPNNVNVAAARQTGSSSRHGLACRPATVDVRPMSDEVMSSAPRHTNPKGQQPMTEPAESTLVEIYIDGRKQHTFIAARLTTHENHETLTLEASRWQPSVMVMPDNPIIPIEGEQPLLTFGVQISEETLAELATDVVATDAEFGFDPKWKFYGPDDVVPACVHCRMVLGENGEGHAPTCITVLAAQADGLLRHFDNDDDTKGEN